MPEKPYWAEKNYAFINHKSCEFFPCHKGLDPARFNCLFCYCPLYALGPRCGGNFSYGENGIKDCSGCLLPHKPENYGYVVERFSELAKLARESK